MIQTGQVIWITGLSGSGKSTVGEGVARALRARQDCVVYLDGDALRGVLQSNSQSDSGVDRDSRFSLALRYSELCKMLSQQGLVVVIATISMFREVHEWNRLNFPDYVEVFLNVPKDVLRRRDPKGIYKGLAEGSLSNVAGFDLEVDEPTDAHLVLNSDGSESPEESIRKVLELILSR